MNSEILETPKEPFAWPETELAKRFGVGLPTLARMRKDFLATDVHFARVKKRICYSTYGARTAARNLELSEADVAWLYPEKNAPEAPAGPSATVRHILVVAPRKTVNAHILVATAPDGSLARVIVKRKDNFRPGMKMECEHQAADLYRFVGNCPRFPGKY